MNKFAIAWASFTICFLVMASCSTQHKVARMANTAIINQPAFAPANVGILVTNAADGKVLYEHNAEKLFVPASNIKLPTCYAAMKYLGDSILSAYYTVAGDRLEVEAAGDPTFLLPEFSNQPLLNLMKDDRFTAIDLYATFDAKPLGRGWAWDDYPEDYMAERDPFPMYGNLATFLFDGENFSTIPPNLPVIGKPEKGKPWAVERELGGHLFFIKNNKGTTAPVKTITMAMDGGAFAEKLLSDTLHKTVERLAEPLDRSTAMKIYALPTDSLLTITMHRSDNFFAEQILLMVSNRLLGNMSDTKVIDTLLKTDLAGLPQRPKWVDGSGLSRYNLFSPADFVWLLAKMKTEFGLDRMKVILPAGNSGTLTNLYTNYEERIFAKSGTLSNVVALSGYLLTKQNKTLLFSVLVNGHMSTAGAVRKQIEAFLTGLIERY